MLVESDPTRVLRTADADIAVVAVASWNADDCGPEVARHVGEGYYVTGWAQSG